jgi:hypothetical protein
MIREPCRFICLTIEPELLNSQQYPAIAPQLFQVIILSLIWREQVDNNVAIIEDQPAFLCLSFDASFFLVILLGGFQHSLGERVEHPVAGAVADDEIIGKGCNVFNVEKQDVFALSILQGGDDLMCKF